MALFPVFAAGALALAAVQAAAPAPVKPDPALPAELVAAVAEMRSRLPIKQGSVTITAVEAKGTEVVYDMAVPNDVDAASFQRFKDNLTKIGCGNPEAVKHFSRGGSYTYRLKDPGGEVFTASIAGC